MFELNPKYAYAFLTLPFLLVWFILFVFFKETRKEQLWMSILIAPLGPITEVLYFQDYWFPASILSFTVGPFFILLEDFIFAFVMGGVGGVIYEVIFSKHLQKARKHANYTLGPPVIFVVAAIVTYLLFQLNTNSIFATVAGFVLAAILMVAQRKDLLVGSLLTGITITFVMFGGYLVLYNSISNAEELLSKGWLLYGTSLDMRVFNIPLTEMVWAFAWGMFVGPLYEFTKKRSFG